MFQLATSYLTLTDRLSHFSFVKQLCGKTHSALVEKGQIISMHQEEKASKETAETEIGLRTAKHINKKWKDGGELVQFSG